MHKDLEGRVRGDVHVDEAADSALAEQLRVDRASKIRFS